MMKMNTNRSLEKTVNHVSGSTVNQTAHVIGEESEELSAESDLEGHIKEEEENKRKEAEAIEEERKSA